MCDESITDEDLRKVVHLISEGVAQEWMERLLRELEETRELTFPGVFLVK